jgi:hypothetical protein
LTAGGYHGGITHRPEGIRTTLEAEKTMTTITPEQRQAIAEAGEAPVPVLDPETNKTYVLISEESYHRICDRNDDDLNAEEMLSHMWEVMKDDWSDPRMDVYDSDPVQP